MATLKFVPMPGLSWGLSGYDVASDGSHVGRVLQCAGLSYVRRGNKARLSGMKCWRFALPEKAMDVRGFATRKAAVKALLATFRASVDAALD